MDIEKLLTTSAFILSFNTFSRRTIKLLSKISFHIHFKDVYDRESFFEFGRETSYTKSSSHAEFKTWLKMVPYGTCFHFIALFCYKALTVNADRTCKKHCLKVVPIKCQG